MAEVMKFSDFKEEGSESAVKVCIFYIDLCACVHAVNFANALYERKHSLNMFCLLQAAGKYRQQGRNYIVEDGDIIFFKFNTPNAPKKKP